VRSTSRRRLSARCRFFSALCHSGVVAAKRRDTPSKGDLREQAILDAAEVLLERERTEPMTVESIAKGAGISRGSLYFYFGSKQEVLAALVARTVARLHMDDQSAGPGLPPRDHLRRAVENTARTWREHGLVMRAAVEFGPEVPEIAQLWRDTIANNTEAMTRVLVAAGVPDENGPTGVAALAEALCWMTERNFYHASTQPGGLDRMTETMVEIWCRILPGG
jgi:AcrR family transcriptional regulator